MLLSILQVTLLQFVCSYGAMIDPSIITPTNRTGRFGNIVVVLEKYASNQAAAKVMKDLTVAVFNEFTGNVSSRTKNEFVSTSIYKVKPLSLFVSEIRGYKNLGYTATTNNTRFADVSDSASSAGLMERKHYIRNMETDIRQGNMWRNQIPLTRDAWMTYPTTPKSVLLLIMNDLVLERPTGIQAFMTAFDNIKQHVTILMFGPTARTEREKQWESLNVPHYSVNGHENTTDQILTLISDLMLITQNHCVESKTHFCNDTQPPARCPSKTTTTFKTKGEFPLGHRCENIAADVVDRQQKCTADCVCPRSCCNTWSDWSIPCTGGKRTRTMLFFGGISLCDALKKDAAIQMTEDQSCTSSTGNNATEIPYTTSLMSKTSKKDNKVSTVILVIIGHIPLYLLVCGTIIVKFARRFYNRKKAANAVKSIKVQGQCSFDCKSKQSLKQKTCSTQSPEVHPKSSSYKEVLHEAPKEKNQWQLSTISQVMDKNVSANLPPDTRNRPEPQNIARSGRKSNIIITQDLSRNAPESAKSIERRNMVQTSKPEMLHGNDAPIKKRMNETSEMESVKSRTDISNFVVKRENKNLNGRDLQSMMNGQGRKAKLP